MYNILSAREWWRNHKLIYYFQTPYDTPLYLRMHKNNSKITLCWAVCSSFLSYLGATCGWLVSSWLLSFTEHSSRFSESPSVTNDKGENDKRIRKQINLAGIDLLSFSLFTGAAVEQDLRTSHWDAHLLWARLLRVRRDPPTTNWHSSACGNLACVCGFSINLRKVWGCMHCKDKVCIHVYPCTVCMHVC